jgi:hypothetical protein
MASKQQQVLAALIARQPTLELDGDVLDLTAGIRFASAAEAESHERVIYNKVPDLCVLCESEDPSGACYRMAARQWIEEYMPDLPKPGRPPKEAADKRTERMVLLATPADRAAILARVPMGRDFSDWALEVLKQA